MTNARKAFDKLAGGDFNALIGTPEGVWIDAKVTPDLLAETKQKLELAKDVSALANAVGGTIVLGFATARDPTTAGELISEVKPFPTSMVDPDQYRKIIHEYIHPPLEVRVQVFPGSNGKGVATMLVESPNGKPYIVSKMVDDQGKNIGAHFGFFERKQDVVPTLSVARILQQLAAGQQWRSIEQRLQAIETSIASWQGGRPSLKRPAITSKIRNQRLKAARIAAGRDDVPLVYYMASPEGECEFPTLFRSRGERVVRLLEKPPQLRPQGFAIWASDSSEIIQGRVRRNLLEGYRLIELWKDGLFVFIAPGDENFLGWRTSGPDFVAMPIGMDKPIPILVEVKSRHDDHLD